MCSSGTHAMAPGSTLDTTHTASNPKAQVSPCELGAETWIAEKGNQRHTLDVVMLLSYSWRCDSWGPACLKMTYPTLESQKKGHVNDLQSGCTSRATGAMHMRRAAELVAWAIAKCSMYIHRCSYMYAQHACNHTNVYTLLLTWGCCCPFVITGK